MYYESKENLLTIKVKNRSLILMKSKTAKLVLIELIELEDFISDLEQPGKALRSYTDSLYMREQVHTSYEILLAADNRVTSPYDLKSRK